MGSYSYYYKFRVSNTHDTFVGTQTAQISKNDNKLIMDLDFNFREIKKLDQQMIRDNQRSKEDAACAGSRIMSGQATWPLEIKIC